MRLTDVSGIPEIRIATIKSSMPIMQGKTFKTAAEFVATPSLTRSTLIFTSDLLHAPRMSVYFTKNFTFGRCGGKI